MFVIHYQQYSYSEPINYCQLLINLDFCLKECAAGVCLVQKKQEIRHWCHCFIALSYHCAKFGKPKERFIFHDTAIQLWKLTATKHKVEGCQKAIIPS